MYAPSRTSLPAAEPGRTRRATANEDRERFRPVALPALAAAMQVSTADRQAARARAAARSAFRIVHEDEPVE